MSRIYVEFSKLEELSKGCESASSKLSDIRKDFQNLVGRLDWDVRFQLEINYSALRISRSLQDYRRTLRSYKQFLDEVYRTYQELDSEEFELKVIAGRTDIFDGTNGYGGDQGDMSHSKNGVKLFGWVFGEDKEIYDFVRKQDGYENYSEAQIHDLLNQINQEGCGYVSLVNALFWEFQGTEEEFEKQFGFPMRDKDGNYNYNRMLIDIYCRTDNKYFLTEDSGKTALICDVLSDYQEHPEKFEQEYGVKYDPSSDTISNEVANAILRKHSDDTVTYKSEGTTIYSQENRLLAYLHDKGIKADVSCSNSDSMNNYSIKNSLESGTVVKLSLAKGADLCDENGNVKQTLGGSHAVLITDVTEDGRYVISSWGEKYYINPAQTYTDSKTGNSNSIINSYLTINVNYK